MYFYKKINTPKGTYIQQCVKHVHQRYTLYKLSQIKEYV